MYLWRAVDDEGEVLDMIVQHRRDTAAVSSSYLLELESFIGQVQFQEAILTLGCC
jgi:hypothetical protein